MTPRVHGRRTLRRLPRGGVLGRRFSVWDAMGYHGIAWASNHGPLTLSRLKEWLRVGWPADDLPWSAPPAPVTQLQVPTLGLGLPACPHHRKPRARVASCASSIRHVKK